MQSNKRTARIAGATFLIVFICGIFAEFFVRQEIIISNDIAGTAQNIKNEESLFRLGIASDLMMVLAFFIYGYLLYTLFKSFHKNLSLLLLLSVSISVAILALNTQNQFGMLLLFNDGLGLTQEQLYGQLQYYEQQHTNGYIIAQLFYGLYLFPLGYMIIKSGMIPKFIGVLLILGCLGDLIASFTHFISPEATSLLIDNVTVPADLGEISMCLWLLIMGVKNKKE